MGLSADTVFKPPEAVTNSCRRVRGEYMRPYTFYLHEHGHEAPSFDFIHCNDQEQAQLHAQMLLERFPEYDAIEIFDGGIWRNRVDRREPSELRLG